MILHVGLTSISSTLGHLGASTPPELAPPTGSRPKCVSHEELSQHRFLVVPGQVECRGDKQPLPRSAYRQDPEV